MPKKATTVEAIREERITAGTFNPLLNALRVNDKKNLFTSNTVSYFHKTGYPLFDFYFGSVVNIHNELGEIIAQEPRIGQAAGTFNMVVGKSGTGKTTLVVQLSANIIRQYPNATIHHYDCEQRFGISRGENIARLPISDFDENGRYILQQGTVTLEDMQEAIIKLYAAKIRDYDALKVPTGQVNEFGKEIMILPPSIIIMDSIANIISDTFSVDNAKELADAEKLRGNSEGMRDAKTIRGFLKDIAPLLKKANIIIYAVNHINANVSMSAFTPPTKQMAFLKQDESIPGGNALFFGSFNLAKLTSKPGDDFTEETDGFAGHMVMVEPVKSSSNQSGNAQKGVSFELVFSFKHGFDSLRSLILYGKEKGLIEGTKPRLKFTGDSSFTFTWKNIDKEKDEKPIWESVAQFIMPELRTHLSFVEPEATKFDERSLAY